jgi:sulfatase maturation enzyme AslB (radical SAM superfamily)
MTQPKPNFVPLKALDKRPPTRRELLRGMVRQAPFVIKNFQLYFRNAWRRHVMRSNVVAPYAVTFYVTHKCNLACSYCTQKKTGRLQRGTADRGDAAAAEAHPPGNRLRGHYRG